MKKIYGLFIGFLLLLLAACQGPAQTPTPANSPAPSETAAPTSTTTPTLTPSLTSPPTETSFPTFTPTLTLPPTATPPTYVRENTPIPVPDEPITAENASQIAELARLGKGAIQNVQLSPNRLFLLVRTTIGIYGYNADRLEEIWRWEDSSGIAAMAVPRLERWIAAATNDGRIALLIYQRGSMFTQWVTGYEKIKDLAFSYDGEMLAAIGDQGVTVWQVGETEPLYKYPEMVGSNIRFTPDGESFTVKKDNRLIFVSLETGFLANTLNLQADELAYSVDGQYFSDSDSINDANDGEILAGLEDGEEFIHAKGINFSQNGKYLAIAFNTGTGVGVWQAETGRLLFILSTPYQEDGPKPYSQVAFSPDGHLLAAAHPNGFVDLWSLETNDFLHRYLAMGENVIFRKASRLTIWNQVEMQDIEPQNEILINRANDFVAGRWLNFSPDGRWLFSDGLVRELDDLRFAFDFGDEIVASISIDGETLFSYDWNAHIFYQRRMNDFGVVSQVNLNWDYHDHYYIIYPHPWQDSPMEYFSVSPIGEYISTYVADLGPTVVTWDIRENDIVESLSASIYSNGFYSPDGKYLIYRTSKGSDLYQLIPEISQMTRSIYSPCGFLQKEGRLLAYYGDEWFILSLVGDRLTEDIELNVDLEERVCPSFFQNNNLLAVSSYSSVWLVNFKSGHFLLKFPAHLDDIASLAFSPDGKYLATSSYDGTVKLWGIPPGE